MTKEELKEAIMLLKIMKCGKKHIDKIEEKKLIELAETLLTLAETVLAVGEVMPKKLYNAQDTEESELQAKYNEAVELCTLAISKKLVGLEDVLKNKITEWLGKCACDKAYTDRKLKDPSCQYCDNEGMDKDLFQIVKEHILK